MDATAAMPNALDTRGVLSSMSSLLDFLSSSPALREGLKLILLGGVVELARRAAGLLWTSFVELFFITAEFEDRDETFTWMMFWLSRQPKWNNLRSLRVTTFRYGQSGVADAVPGESEESARQLAYVPSHNKALNIWYQNTWMSVTLYRTQGDMWNRRGDERLTITLFTRRTAKLDELLREAKSTYKKHSEGRVNIYVSDGSNEWSLAGSRPKRPMSSVVLEKGVKERLLADARDFMASERWYADRGIPWRRGYLLHGVPGSGKTSLIHSIAGELGLDIYVITLSKRTLDDSALNELISKLPARSVAIIEEIDTAGISRGNMALGVPLMPGQPPGEGTVPFGPTTDAPQASMQSSGAVTLSGLLGAIDGVAAQEGRILFATTNKYTSLDSALVRPGRLDVHVRFNNAGRWQAEELFRCFYPPVPEDEADPTVRGRKDKAPLDEAEHSQRVDICSVSLSKNSTTKEKSLGSELSDGERASSVMHVDGAGFQSPRLSRREVERLAEEFALRVPEGEFSMAALQGLLMQYKTRPYQVIEAVEPWVVYERQKRAEREGRVPGLTNSDLAESTVLPSDEKKAGVSGGVPGDEKSETTPAEIPHNSEPYMWWPMGFI